jgi:capsular polysaccharide biosynthesis protein
MHDADGVQVVDVDLPHDPAPPPRSRTVQAELHPMFTASYSHEAHDLRVAIIPRGRLVTGSGVVITARGELLLETLWDAPHLAREFGRPRRLSPARRLPGTHVSLISLWCGGYFHWLFNSLPKLAVLAASGVEYDGLIVPERLAPFHRETLALLGIDESRCVPFTGQHVQPDVLVWVSPLSPINHPTSYMLDWVRTSLGTLPRDPPTRRFYVTRTGTRRVVNEVELFAALEPLGFEFVVPEARSFQEQVELFAQARVLVGPHGSNFVNGMFSPKLSALECFQPAHVNWGVYGVLCGVGHEHWNLLCPAVRRPLRPRRFDDMVVPVDLVLETLDRMLPATRDG